MQVSISYTTRPARKTEVDGHDYHFVSSERFQQMRDQQAFIEHAQVFGNHYGTAKSDLNAILAAGNHALLEVDWQGAQQIRRSHAQAVMIYIFPPDPVTLRQRLFQRCEDDVAEMEQRLAHTRHDLSHCSGFDYFVVNDDFDRAKADLQRIVDVQAQAMGQQRNAVAQLVAAWSG